MTLMPYKTIYFFPNLTSVCNIECESKAEITGDFIINSWDSHNLITKMK